jgi:ATP-dependent HslUV protease ATP-binding subunit HslU
MVRELLDNAISIVRADARQSVTDQAEQQTEERLLDLLFPRPAEYEFSVSVHKPSEEEQTETGESLSPRQRSRERMRTMLRNGDLEQRPVELTIEQKATPIMMGGMGLEQMDVDFQGMLEKIMPTSRSKRNMDIASARKVIFEQECEKLLDNEKIYSRAITLAENSGIIFIDEIDKVIASESKSADVSRQGVQRDLLPIVEGTTVNSKHGYIRTDHILFIAAGAFHKHQPSELMPELQGRFPIRVELDDLTKEDFVRILTEPQNSLTKQYAALIGTENIELNFTTDAIEALATFAYQVNQSTINIGARRLYTILEHLLEELSFEASDLTERQIQVDAEYVNQRLAKVVKDEDLSKYIL